MVQSFLLSSFLRWLRGLGPPHRAARPLRRGVHLCLALALLCGALVGASAQLASAQRAQEPSAEADVPSRGTTNVSPEVAQKAAAIARQTMSPFCPGRTLSDCPSEYATAWRRDIRAMVARGMSADEIQRELESRVGSNLSGSPNRGAGYGVSLGLALGAALVLFFVLSRLRLNSQANKNGEARGNAAAQTDQSSTQTSSNTPHVADAATDPAAPAGASPARTATSPATLVDDERLESELLAANGDDD
jgi:cytochrome c-type biogenesis protein CcmH/NrfF